MASYWQTNLCRIIPTKTIRSPSLILSPTSTLHTNPTNFTHITEVKKEQYPPIIPPSSASLAGIFLTLALLLYCSLVANVIKQFRLIVGCVNR